MTKSYEQLQQQITKLQKEAEKLKAKEKAGVVDRIQVAITHYGLTVADLFPAGGARKGRGAKASTVAASSPKAEKAAKRQPSLPKYTDGAGKTWTGVGKRPHWYVAAIESGKTPKDLKIPAAP